MSNQSWILEIAKQLQPHHRVADAHRLALMEVTSTGEYRRFLERVYGFETAIELVAATIPGLQNAVSGASRRAARLHEDLIALGATPAGIAALPRPNVTARTASECLGWLLVIERHVLLAGLARRYLAGKLPAALDIASRYLDTHPDGGRRYRVFGDVLDDCIHRGIAEPAAILAAATQAFEVQRRWYSRLAQLARSGVRSYGHREVKPRATPELALRPDPPAVRVDNTLRDVQPEPGGAPALGGRLVRLEQRGQQVGLDPRPGVLDREQHVRIAAGTGDRHPVTRPAELDRVPEEVPEQLQHAVAVAP